MAALLGVGLVSALTTWNARKTGEMLANLTLVRRQDNPVAFQIYLVARFASAAVVILIGALGTIFLRS